MKHPDTFEEIGLDESIRSPGNLIDALCEECGTTARFNSTEEQLDLGKTFEVHCYSCNSGQFPGLGETRKFRVVDINPDRDSYPNNPSSPSMYLSDDSD